MPTLHLLSTLMLACMGHTAPDDTETSDTASDGSTVQDEGASDSGSGDGGADDAVVVATFELPPAATAIEAEFFIQALADVNAVTGMVAEERDPNLVGLANSGPIDIPIPMASSADGCWIWGDAVKGFAEGGMGDAVTIAAGSVSATLENLDGFYHAEPDGPVAEAFSTPGTGISVEGEDSGAHIVAPLQGIDAVRLWADINKRATARIDWDPDHTVEDAFIVLLVYFDDGFAAECALRDDGHAELDLTAATGNPTTLLVGRGDLRVMTHSTLGRVMVSTRRDLWVGG